MRDRTGPHGRTRIFLEPEVRNTFRSCAALPAFVLMLAAGGCGSSMSITRTYEDRTIPERGYEHVLVLAIAADYNARSRFERQMALALRDAGATATPYYEIADGDREITRDKIRAVVDSHGFDGVVVSRIGAHQSEVTYRTGTSKARISRKTGDAVDFFRYDYEILNEPGHVDVATEVLLVTDFVSADDDRVVWSAESKVADKENISYLVDDAVAMIVGRMTRDGVVGN